jgi:allophanate hydrolase subunit 2
MATVAEAAMWKIGQLRPVGDRVRFVEVTVERAVELARELDESLTEKSLEDV